MDHTEHFHEDSSRELRVLVSGSHRFQDRSFVFSMLNGFKAGASSWVPGGKLGTIISGPFSGADDFAREWAKENHVSYERMDIPDSEALNLAFFDNRKLPELVIRHDPKMRKAYDRLRNAAPDMVFLIPNPEGELGPTSSCLRNICDTMEIPCADGASALKAVSARLAEAEARILSEREASSDHSTRPAQVSAL